MGGGGFQSFSFGGPGVQFQSMGGGAGPRTSSFSSSASSSASKPVPTRYEVPCSLEEIFRGTNKRFRVTQGGVAKTLTVEVKPGYKEGTKITFEGKARGEGDIIFVIKEKPHALFKRDGNDLVITRPITLDRALSADFSGQLRTLDGRALSFEVREVIGPKSEKVVRGEGMPVRKTGKRGNLRIKFDIQFPKSLSPQQRRELSRILSPESAHY